jgi:ATP phosphoribosyltransferase regulatory subunit
MTDNRWRLPHGVDDLLPPEAQALEYLRRRILDLFLSWGYDYIEPPLVEYLDSLLVGSGRDLDLQTLKVIDQQSGRMLGVRADVTSQAVRIDAHSRRVAGIQRLCYTGPVVRANPRGPLDSRLQFKAGAELFGSTSPAADAEVIGLMLRALSVAGFVAPVLLLGHMGVFRALTGHLDLSPAHARQLFEAVQRKSETDIAELIAATGAPGMLIELPSMMGDATVVEAARKQWQQAPDGVHAALDELESVADRVRSENPGVAIRYDLSELSGYGYHNGPVFAAYLSDQGAPIAQGGRYDGIGAHFGYGRPATGFDMNLLRLLAGAREQEAIWVPFMADPDPARSARIRQLREAGEVVIMALDTGDPAPSRCVRELVKDADGGSEQPETKWVLRGRHGP